MSVSEANNNAATQTTNESSSAVGTCPFEKGEIQLIPMRYAISEESEQLPLKYNGSLYKDDKVYQGIRPLNEGYLYLIHDSDSKILYEYAVSSDNSLVGRQFVKGDTDFTYNYLTKIFVPTCGKLLAMFMPVALTPERADILLTAYSDQSDIMNSVYLSTKSVANGTKGLMPLQVKEQSTLSSAIDFVGKIKESNNKEDFGEYLWLKDDGLKTKLQSTIQSSVIDDKNAAILLVNDICSDISDIEEKQNSIKKTYQKYYNKKEGNYSNAEKFYVSSLINNFMKSDRFIEEKKEKIINDVGVSLSNKDDENNFFNDINKYFNILNDSSNWSNYGGIFSDGENKKADRYSKEISEKYNIENEPLKNKMLSIRKDFNYLIDGGDYNKKGIKDVIKYDSMDEFYNDWRSYKNTVSESLTALNTFAKLIHNTWGLYNIYISPKIEGNIEIKLVYEDTLVQFFKDNDDKWLSDYYTGNDESHLFVYDDISPNLLSVKDSLTIKNKIASIQSALDAPAKFSEKIVKANELAKEVLTNISEQTQKRIQRSIGHKFDYLFIEQMKTMETLSFSGKTKPNYAKFLEMTLDSYSPGVKRLLFANMRFYGLEWVTPNSAISGELIELFKNCDKNMTDKNLETKNIKKIKSEYRQGRKRARTNSEKNAFKKAYNDKIRASKKIKKAHEKLFFENEKKIKSKIGKGSSVIDASSTELKGKSLLDFYNENKELANKIKNRTNHTVKELIISNDTIDINKISSNGLKAFVWGQNIISAYGAWKAFLDNDPKEGELTEVVTSSVMAFASSLSIIVTTYSALANSTISNAKEITAFRALMGRRMAMFTVRTQLVASAFATCLLGIKTIKAWDDFWDNNGNANPLISKIAQVRFLTYAISTGFSAAETISWMFSNSAVNAGIIEAEAGVFGRLVAIGSLVRTTVILWLATYFVEKLYAYYKLPFIADWCQKSLWGTDNQNWTLEDHVQPFHTNAFQPSVTCRDVLADNLAVSDVILTVNLPHTLELNENNFKLAILGYKYDPNGFGMVDYDLFYEVANTCTEVYSSDGSLLELYLPIDVIKDASIIQLSIKCSVLDDKNKWVTTEKSYCLKYTQESSKVRIFDNVLIKINRNMYSWI